ncbi:Osmotically-inducible protein OsmY, contains BON domain [Duganella sp. CF402]|uniref:BON domain-containing protein n=1 Tax=unclassified Duganella TaxID=2636909 RepID=UPI0008C0961D|nr:MULTISPECIES: BON domain-containing protein [unclassified Duganella]RZT05561.1 osmotically-inducible protein OsmY [Duganella sp. BK701]SEM99568.1 Osmotically-inducible protein OsmY, contains BON domain [Duganella sp. CF402]
MSNSSAIWKKVQRPLAMSVLCGAMLASLSGCVALVAGGAISGTLAASDRRTFGAQTEDRAIEVKGAVKVNNVGGDAAHVNINSFNRRALLTGEVRDEAMKAQIEREIRSIEGVVDVINELEIAGPASYTSRSSDTIITTKVKASLVDAKDISANSYQVVTERGVVYLQGRVTQREGQIGADIARGVSGVTKVVKVFEYISEEEWKSYQPKPANTNSQSSQ